MESLIQTFHIDWKIMLAQGVNFAIVLFVLWRFAIKPLRKLMEERNSKIAHGLKEGERNTELVKETEKAYQEALTKARKEGTEILTEAKKNAEVKRAELLVLAEKDVAILMENSKKSLQAEKQKMLDEAKKELGNLVVTATEKVLAGTVTPKIDAILVDHAIKELK